jgi:hypothetical protein
LFETQLQELADSLYIDSKNKLCGYFKRCVIYLHIHRYEFYIRANVELPKIIINLFDLDLDGSYEFPINIIITEKLNSDKKHNLLIKSKEDLDNKMQAFLDSDYVKINMRKIIDYLKIDI